MPKVSAADFQRQFGAYAEAAQREPVTITKHGRDSLVVMSIDEFERLQGRDTRKSYALNEAPEEFVRALETAKAPEWAKAYNHELDEE